MKVRWTVGLAQQARQDFSAILHWTTEHFGRRQARDYGATLRSALKALADGPGIIGCRSQEELGSGVLSLHVARQGRKGRHFILLRGNAETSTIEVLRILHDSMDLARHLDA